MSITDELRGFANSGMSAMECSAYSDKLIDIADRIDKTHEEELAKLKAENTKLREEFDKMDVWHSKELTAAMDENAKLRKLARLMWKPFCWAQSGYEVCLTDEQEAEIRDMARELGIEEDE